MATIIKLKRSTVADRVPTTSDLVDGEVGINIADKKIYVNNGGTITEISDSTGSGEVGAHLIPATDDTYDLGSSSKRWRTAYLSASTIDLGGATISSDGSGTVSIAASGVTIPLGSKVGTETIAGGKTETAVLLRTGIPFYKTGDLSTANATFDFKASGGNERVFNDFTLASGQAITTQETALFSF